ncbi:UDP-N-acetylmuramate dehydrogenase [Candidatus Saccharibacteria bacterium]|nr:UDP-N-acetylmuramate dehydrogenase [Candidatus Saccharibacteria bacterium]
MRIQKDFLLSKLVTMKLGGRASFVVTVRKKQDIPKALAFARSKKLPWFVLGGGSNVIGADFYNGVVILVKIGGIKRSDNYQWHFGAGVVLDTAIEKTIKAGSSGLECMSGIPGTVGGAPVHNAGAYGQELSDVVTSVEAYDVAKQEFVSLSHKSCKFEYLSSIFKNHPGKYIITGLNVQLRPSDPQMTLGHPGLKQHLKEHGVVKVSPKLLRRAVLNLRAERLPSLEKHASAGSFFKNPILSARKFAKFHKAFPGAPFDKQPSGEVKIFSGWLLEQAGLKGVEKFGFASYSENALVVINKSAKTLAELENYTQFASDAVFEKFGVTLERDPDIIA